MKREKTPQNKKNCDFVASVKVNRKQIGVS